jgi:hypothetical protein
MAEAALLPLRPVEQLQTEVSRNRLTIDTYGDVIVLFEFDAVRDFEVVYLLEEIQAMSHGRDIKILERLMVQMHKHISGNLVIYRPISLSPRESGVTTRGKEGVIYPQRARDTAAAACSGRASSGHRRRSTR